MFDPKSALLSLLITLAVTILSRIGKGIGIMIVVYGLTTILFFIGWLPKDLFLFIILTFTVLIVMGIILAPYIYKDDTTEAEQSSESCGGSSTQNAWKTYVFHNNLSGLNTMYVYL